MPGQPVEHALRFGQSLLHEHDPAAGEVALQDEVGAGDDQVVVAALAAIIDRHLVLTQQIQ